MKKILIIISLFLISIQLFSIERVARITLHSTDIREECRKIGIVPDSVVGINQVDIVLTDVMIEEIESKGYFVEIVISDYSKYLRSLLSNYDWNQYHNHATTVVFVESLAQANPNIVLVDTIGYSVQNRVIQAIKISDNPSQDEFEPEIRFDGLHHGDETPATEVPLWLAYRLCEGYGSNSYITSLVDNREIWIVPMINPDGRHALQRYNANGIDLNREYGYMWDRAGSSPYPFSQPESQALRSLMDSRNFTVAASYHTGIIFISQAWSYHYDPPLDNNAYNEVWGIYSAITGYPHEQGSHGMYYINGPTKDYDYGPSGCIGSTVEVSRIKNPPACSIQVICDRDDSAMFEIIRESSQGIAGFVTDSITGDPLWARVTVQEIGWPFFTDKNFGDYHRYVLPGTYSIEVSAPGYRSKTVSGIGTYNDTFVQIDIALAPMDTSFAFCAVLGNVPNYNDQNHTVTPSALGEPDGNYLSLGVSTTSAQRQGWFIFDMGPNNPIYNRTGNDIQIVEGNDGSTEACSVYVGNNRTWTGPWYFVGMTNGTSEIDISSSGLSSARYIMLVDDGNSSYSGGSPGYDVDAIINYGRPGEASLNLINFSFSPPSPDPGDTTFLNLSIENIGLYTATNVQTTITSISSYITMIDSVNFIANIPSEDTHFISDLNFEISASTPQGTVVDIYVNIQADGGINITDTVSLLVGFEEFCDSVENGQGTWTHSGSNDLWHITEHTSHSPTHSWYCGNEGSWVYSNNMNASLISQSIYINSGCYLEFWERYGMESGWDFIFVEYTINGTTWNILRSTSNSNLNWHLTNFDLSSIPVGSNTQFRFRLESDGSALDSGWYIDDIRVYSPSGIEEVILTPVNNISIMSVSTINTGSAIFRITGVDEENPGNILIFDIAGRKINSIDIRRSGIYVWNGKDNNNNSVGASNYFAILKANNNTSACKFIMF